MHCSASCCSNQLMPHAAVCGLPCPSKYNAANAQSCAIPARLCYLHRASEAQWQDIMMPYTLVLLASWKLNTPWLLVSSTSGEPCRSASSVLHSPLAACALLTKVAFQTQLHLVVVRCPLLSTCQMSFDASISP
jgi:hypothetical protein